MKFIFTGNANRNVLPSTRWDDELHGMGGNDLLRGGRGDDTIIGGTGNDVMRGGQGADTFSFARGDGQDRIGDFTPGEDTLRFTGISPREITYRDTDAGVEVRYGGLAGTSANAGTILLQDVTTAELSPADWLFG